MVLPLHGAGGVVNGVEVPGPQYAIFCRCNLDKIDTILWCDIGLNKLV
jgi:hypothetical protein